jgi:hypothetical protein
MPLTRLRAGSLCLLCTDQDVALVRSLVTMLLLAIERELNVVLLRESICALGSLVCALGARVPRRAHVGGWRQAVRCSSARPIIRDMVRSAIGRAARPWLSASLACA